MGFKEGGQHGGVIQLYQDSLSPSRRPEVCARLTGEREEKLGICELGRGGMF